MSLDSDILQALAGRSAQQPMKVANLAELLAVSPARVEAALVDLHDRRVVNRATVTKAGETSEVVWPTGMQPPAGPNWRTQPILKHTWADAKAAHEAQARAEASRETQPHTPGGSAPSSPLESPPAPLLQRGENTPTQETVMPRIAKPAKPAKPQAAAETQTRKVEKTAKLSTPYIKAPNGTIIDEALAALAGTTRETALATDQILALCPSVASVGSLRSTLRRQVELGRVCTDGRTDRRKLRYFWWDAATDAKPAPAQVAPIHHATLNDGHEKNLDTLRRIGAEDHSPEPTKLIEPDPLQAVADALDLDAPGTTRFALWDDGQLLVAAGDDMMVLDAGSTRRLADFLESCMGL